MAVQIKFDNTHNAIEPTMVLAKKNGKFLGVIQASKIHFKDMLNSPSEFSFTVYKGDYENKLNLWDNIDDFKIVWIKEWNRCYEIYVETTDEGGIYKSITAKSLGEAELSQINLYGIEINTENDIARDNYVPTVLYSADNTSSSLLHRISGKIPHYSYDHIDNSIKNIQRTFSFDGKSIYDCFQEIAEEIHCLFDIQCKYENGVLTRKISVYDLDTYCPVCGERGSFVAACSKCGNTVGLTQGYGNDTGIIIDTENLADTITYKTDNESVKNCFKLEAGDDLMTATVISNNPNGSAYIWCIPPKTKQDMSLGLVSKLEDYDELYDYYLDEYESTIPQSRITAYNQLVTKYQIYNQDYQTITYPIIGFSKIIEANYNIIDMYLFLKSGLMPTVSVASTNATIEAAKLTANNLSPVAVQNISVCSSTSAESAVLSTAKTIVDNRYKIDITTTSFTNNTWTGSFTLTNYSDDEDTAASSTISITINDNYEKYVKQKIDKVISKTVADGEPTDIVSLFNLSNSNFETEIRKYCLTRLQNFHDCCQSCLDVLIQQGVADKTLWNNQVSDLYTTMYLPYYTKLGLLESELQLRENEIKVIIGDYYSDGRIKTSGLQTLIEKEKTKIQKALNFENYLGQTLWLEFASFRREDTYKNDNYISDGLNNAELFEKALRFIDTAKKDIIKSATLQHTITATLKNLLVMPEFSPLLNQFEVGNWLRARIDGNIYKLRLLDYEIDFDNLNTLNVTFSDVVYGQDEVSDIKSIISQAKSISTTYGAVTRQMEQGRKTTRIIDGWVENGLNVTNTKIVCQADNQTYTSDEHGMLFRKHDSVNDVYDNKQLKLTNSTLAITNDNWETVKSAVGLYYYFDPVNHKLTEGYGVIAETIIGKLILGEQLGIYNNTGSLTFNHNGLNVTNGTNTFNFNPNATNLLTISKTANNTTQNIFYVDNNGTLHITGDGSGLDISANNSITGLSSSLQQTANSITATVAATYETKTDATTKLNTAKGYTDTEITGAKSYADSGISTAKTTLESQITQTANSITSTVAESQSKYDTTGYAISIYGYGNPTNTAYPPSNHNNEYYLNQSNGSLWLCNGSTWSQSNTLSLITDNLSSQITQTATSITTTVSNTYETKTDATSKLNTAKGYTDTEILGAKGYTDSSISTATTAISSQITQTADSIKSTIANSQSKYNTTGYAISIYGYGNPTNTAYPSTDHNGDYYLNQSNGSLWLCDGSSWSQSTTLSLITDDLSSQIIQTANSITSTVASNQSKYDTTGYTISIYRYSNPTTTDYPPSDYNGYYYLNQSNGNLYYCDGSSWISLRRLPLISDSMRTQITQNSDNISLIANKNASGTVLSLKPDVVNIAWNGLSQNIQFDTPASTPSLSIYTSSNKILMRLNKTGLKLYNGVNTFYPLIHFKTDGINIFESGTAHLNYKLDDKGNHFYLNSEQIGFMGSTKWSTNNTFRGMVTQLGKTCNFIAWSHTEEVEVDGETKDRNIVKLIYYPDKDVEGNDKKGFLFYDKVAFNNVVNCYNDLNMNGHTINNAVIVSSSDVRMKTNIKDTEVNALEQINQIELKSFDWIENNEHENIGIIAQQLQEIIPDTVYEDPETTKLSIQPLKLIPYLIKAIQELSIDMGKSNTKGKINTKSNNSYWNIDLESKINFVNQNIVHNNATKDIQLEILKLKTNELEMSEKDE